MCAGLSEQVFDLQTPSVTDRDDNSDYREVFSSPTDLLSPPLVPYLSAAIYGPGFENTAQNSPLTPEAPSTTLSSTPESYSSISNESTQLNPVLVATGQAPNPSRLNFKTCGLCQELFNGSEQLLDHLKTIHPDMANSCGRKDCRKSKDRRTLLRHLESSKAHQCNKTSVFRCRCGSVFSRKDKFRNHFRRSSCTGDLPFVCLCDKVDISKVTFEVHFEGCGRRPRGRPRKEGFETAGKGQCL